MTSLRPLISGVFNFMNEIWKDIPEYEGLYQVSNIGRVKSLPKKINNRHSFYISKEKLRKHTVNKHGYISIGLCKNGKYKQFRVHQLVAMAFLNHRLGGKLVVDHINEDKLDNRVENLQMITQRENTIRSMGNYVKNKTSKYLGVHWHNSRNRWRVRIWIDGKQIHLGTFKDEYEAHLAYLKAVSGLK